jgi:hypothetical protein
MRCQCRLNVSAATHTCRNLSRRCLLLVPRRRPGASFSFLRVLSRLRVKQKIFAQRRRGAEAQRRRGAEAQRRRDKICARRKLRDSASPREQKKVSHAKARRRKKVWTPARAGERVGGKGPDDPGTKKGPAEPRIKMGADVATSPHLSRVRTAAPVRAWRLSRAGRNSIEASSSGTPVGFRPRSCDPGRFPFAGPSPEGSGSAGRSKKVGSACASRFSFDRPPSLQWPPSRKMTPASAVVAIWNFSPLPEIRSSSRTITMTRRPESRQAESGGSCLWITGISWISRAFRRPLSVPGRFSGRSAS